MPAVRDVVSDLDVHDVQQAVAVDVAAAQGEVPGIRRAAVEAGVRRVRMRRIERRARAAAERRAALEHVLGSRRRGDAREPLRDVDFPELAAVTEHHRRIRCLGEIEARKVDRQQRRTSREHLPHVRDA